MKVLLMTRQAFRVFYTVGLPANCKINLDINIYLQFSWKWVQEILYLTLLSFSLMGGGRKSTQVIITPFLRNVYNGHALHLQ